MLPATSYRLPSADRRKQEAGSWKRNKSPDLKP